MKKSILCLIGLCLFWSSTASAIIIGDLDQETLNITSGGGAEVSIQDQHTPTLIVPMNKVTNTTTLSALTVINESTFDVVSTAGFIDGAFVTLSCVTANRFYVARQLGVVSGSTVTVDTPLDFAFPAGCTATAGTHHMNVNGSVTTQVFSLRAADPGIPVVIDITRIIFQCTTNTAVSLSKFGDLAPLVKGLVLRRVDGTYANIFNVKTNGELAAIMYDWTPYLASNPAQGEDGFVARLTFAGQSKMGVTIRVGAGEDLEVLVQDDLSGLLEFIMIVEGHVVDPN